MATHTRLTTTRLTTTLLTLTLTLLTGCTQTNPTPPPPEPSPTCTPEAGGTPYPCTHAEHQQMTTKNNLYTQAETVYRQYLVEDERINRSGGITEPSKALLETTTGDYLKNSMEIYRELKRVRATAVGGEYRVAWIRRVPAQVMNGSVVAMRACIDASTIKMGSSVDSPKPGLINEVTAYFVRVGSAVKISASQYKVVGRC